MPSRYGDAITRVIPAHVLPPIGSSSRICTTSSGARSRAGNRITHNTASSISTAEISSRFAVPMVGANRAVAAEPSTEPSVPPTAMKPNSRLACSLRNESAMNAQKIDTTNRLKTLVHTKNTRPIQMSPTDPSAGATTFIST